MTKSGADTFGGRLKAALNGRSNRWLAQILDISEGTVRNYLKDITAPDYDLVAVMAKEMGVHPNWLFSGTGEPSPSAVTYELDEKRRLRESAGAKTLNEPGGFAAAFEFVQVPFFEVPVSAGAGRYALSDAPNHTIAYRRDYLNRRGLIASNLVELPIAGDSMSPELESGDTVLVDKSRTNVAGDGIYVLAIDGLLYCKRLQLLPGRMLRVVSINPAYSTYDVQLPDEDGGGSQIEIIGRVVRQGRDR